MLIASKRHSQPDLLVWGKLERFDAILSGSVALQSRIDRAVVDLLKFVDRVRGKGYIGVSWGKDSVVAAHLALKAGVVMPLVWIRVEPIKNPDCVLVRDAFLADHPCIYEEIEVWCSHDDQGWHATGTLEAGLGMAAKKYGANHISGVRMEESNIRKLRGLRWGTTTAHTCAPLSRWTGQDIFAYLYKFGLPVHPAYACSFGGMIDRIRLRVSSLGGERGSGHGRRDWEQRYYGEL